MAFSRPMKLMSFSSLLLLLVLVLVLISLAKAQRPTETIVEFYLQDLASGSNATVVPITGIKNKPLSFNSFGTIFAIDDPITQTSDRNSTEIGRAQGMLVASALSGSNVHVSMSFAFSNGSSLEIQGTSRQFERYKELSVVSGTGSFRYVRGYATLETIYYDNKTSYSIVRCTVRIIQS